MRISKYFDPQPVNTGLQKEVDLLKGFALLFTVWVHVVMLLCTEWELPAEIVYAVWGGPYAAPMFMLSLGLGMCFSRKKSAQHLFHRAKTLFIVGLLLNVARYCIPGMISAEMYHYTYSLDSMYHDLFFSDILQFASLAFLFMAIARKRKWSLEKKVLIGIICSLAGQALRWKNTGNAYVDVLLGFLWGTGTDSFFTFLNWIIFPIIGECVGEALLRCRDKNSVYLHLSPICLLLGAGYVWYSFFNRINLFGELSNYYYLTLIDAFFIALLFIGLLGQNALLITLFKGWHFPLLTRLSRNLNAVYCIHWSLLGWICIALSTLDYGLSFAECTLLSIALLLVSDQLAIFYTQHLRPILSITPPEKMNLVRVRILVLKPFFAMIRIFH